MDYGVEKKVIKESTRINLLGNVLVLITGKYSKIDHADIEPGLDLANLADDGRIATGDSRRSRSGSTPRPRWRNLACGRPSSGKWP
jgi:molybdate transport system substrate-binding protein